MEQPVPDSDVSITSGVPQPKTGIAKLNPITLNKIKIFYWNAGGLSPTKAIELDNLIIQNNADVFGIIDAGSFADNEDLLNDYFKNFQIFTLKRSRKISCGIIVGVRKVWTCKSQIIKTMSNIDKMEALRVEIFIEKERLNLIFLYNPPQNKTCYDLIDIDEKSILIGDFNSHSSRWGYSLTDSVGKIIEEFLDSNPVQRIPSSTLNDFTFFFTHGC